MKGARLSGSVAEIPDLRVFVEQLDGPVVVTEEPLPRHRGDIHKAVPEGCVEFEPVAELLQGCPHRLVLGFVGRLVRFAGRSPAGRPVADLMMIGLPFGTKSFIWLWRYSALVIPGDLGALGARWPQWVQRVSHIGVQPHRVRRCDGYGCGRRLRLGLPFRDKGVSVFPPGEGCNRILIAKAAHLVQAGPVLVCNEQPPVDFSDVEHWGAPPISLGL